MSFLITLNDTHEMGVEVGVAVIENLIYSDFFV